MVIQKSIEGAPRSSTTSITMGVPVEQPYTGITATKVKRTALYVLSAVTSVVGVGSLMRRDDRIFSLPLFMSSGGAFYVAWNLKDYEDTSELQKMREQAVELPFLKMVKEHGLPNITKYGVVSPELLQNKFLQEYSTTPFSILLKTYPFKTIGEHQLVLPKTLRSMLFEELQSMEIGALKIEFLRQCFYEKVLTSDEFQAFRKLYDRAQEQFSLCETKYRESDTKYSRRTDRLLQELRDEEAKIPQNAKVLEQQIRRNGYAATNSQANTQIVIDALFTDKKASDLIVDQVDRRCQGQTITDEAARKTAQDFQRTKLIEIKAQRHLIQKEGVGQEAQVNYQAEIAQARKEYEESMKPLQTQFQEVVRAFSNNPLI